MNRIQNAFQKGTAFIGFITGGDPNIEKSVEFIDALVAGGTDLIEIGIPFSDPIAEGEVIQDANLRALRNGSTTDSIFEIAEKVRNRHDIPIVFLTYLNPVFHYGYERFFGRCKDVGVDGIIIPDMPLEERGELSSFAEKNEVDIITLIAPTSTDRISLLATEAKGFIYVVSSMGVTGIRKDIQTDLESMLALIKGCTDTPVAIGFGISTEEQAKKYSQIADGVIVGSAIVKLIAEHGEGAVPYLHEYAQKMKQATASKKTVQ